jgi:hypothetical protein
MRARGEARRPAECRGRTLASNAAPYRLLDGEARGSSPQQVRCNQRKASRHDV